MRWLAAIVLLAALAVASSAYAIEPFSATQVGATPGTAACQSVLPVSQITSTDIHTFTNIGWICGFVIANGSAAQTIALVEVTGTLCASNQTVLIGSGTVASGVSLAINGNIALTDSSPWLKLQASADHLCLLQSGSTLIAGVITYTDHP